ncbi:MAG: metal transporter [Chloroflexota bacterium]
MDQSLPSPKLAGRAPAALTWLLPLVVLAAMIWAYLAVDPLHLAQPGLPPVEALSLQRIRVTRDGFVVDVVNSGPQPVTLAQVMVDDAYWTFQVDPAPTLPRLGRARVTVPYPWVRAEPSTITLVTSTGLTFSRTVDLAVETPQPGLRQVVAYGLLGVYVGIIPVGLGMLWFPALRRLGRRGMGAPLSLTLGLLVFLLVDTALEALEVAGEVPGVFQGVPLALFAAVATWLAIVAVGRKGGGQVDNAAARWFLAGLIALGIGLHNLGEGLAIGAAFAQGSPALGSFLVVGFTLHKITEGVGIVAPIVRERPSLLRMAGLVLLAGAPAILGAWIGGFSFSSLLATAFFGVGVGAIWQVIVEVFVLLRQQTRVAGEGPIRWENLAGFFAGLLIMYLTAFLVK